MTRLLFCALGALCIVLLYVLPNRWGRTWARSRQQKSPFEPFEEQLEKERAQAKEREELIGVLADSVINSEKDLKAAESELAALHRKIAKLRKMMRRKKKPLRRKNRSRRPKKRRDRNIEHDNF